MYVAEHGNNRVQVIDSSGQFASIFGQEGERKLKGPIGLFIADKYVYVSDSNENHVALTPFCHLIWEAWSGGGTVFVILTTIESKHFERIIYIGFMYISYVCIIMISSITIYN